MRTTLAAIQQNSSSADSALIIRHVWRNPRFKVGDAELGSPFYCVMGGASRGRLLEFGESVLPHVPAVEKGPGSAPKLAHRWKHAAWHGNSDFADSSGSDQITGSCMLDVFLRVIEQRWSEQCIQLFVETPQKPRTMTSDSSTYPSHGVAPQFHPSLLRGKVVQWNTRNRTRQ